MDYRETVLEYAESRKNFTFKNSTRNHAAAITEALLLNTQTEYRLYTGKFDADFYASSEILFAFEKFIKKPFAKIKILSRDKIDIKSHPWITRANELGKSNSLEFRCAKGNYAGNEAKHFSVMDYRGYRYEVEEDKNCENVRALANFNDPDLSKKLAEVFDKAFEYSSN